MDTSSHKSLLVADVHSAQQADDVLKKTEVKWVASMMKSLKQPNDTENKFCFPYYYFSTSKYHGYRVDF